MKIVKILSFAIVAIATICIINIAIYDYGTKIRQNLRI